jgi:homoserine dehydrogenase
LSSKTIRIGVVGCGVIGTGALEILLSNYVLTEMAERGLDFAATVVMLTHEAQEGAVREALQLIDALPHTLAPTRLLRFLR